MPLPDKLKFLPHSVDGSTHLPKREGNKSQEALKAWVLQWSFLWTCIPTPPVETVPSWEAEQQQPLGELDVERAGTFPGDEMR